MAPDVIPGARDDGPAPASTPGRVAARLRRAIAPGLLLAAVVLAAPAATALAHDDIAGSEPPAGSTIDEPISSVEIDFGEVVGDDTTLFLTYDLGDEAGTVDELGGTTVLTGDTTARLDFPELEREGRYFVRYLAPVPADGHVISGSVSFTWGDPPGGGFPVVPFAVGAAIVLSIGAGLSWRRFTARTDASDADQGGDVHGDGAAGPALDDDGAAGGPAAPARPSTGRDAG